MRFLRQSIPLRPSQTWPLSEWLKNKTKSIVWEIRIVIRIIFWKYSSQVYSIPDKSSFMITAPKMGKRKEEEMRQENIGRESTGRKGLWSHFSQGGRGGPGFGLQGVSQSTVEAGKLPQIHTHSCFVEGCTRWPMDCLKSSLAVTVLEW